MSGAHKGLLLGLSLLAGAVAKGDDSAVAGVGGSAVAMKLHATIRMVSERVDMWLPTGRVRAQFVFRNEGPATVVQMGFPEAGSAYAPLIKTTLFKFFRTSVDGKRFAVKRMSEKRSEGYAFWWVKTVPFAKNQTRHVVCEYRADPGFSTDDSHSFSYRLDTGATWKGTIGDAVLVAHLKRFRGFTISEISPKPVRVTATRVEWRRRNFEPERHKPWGSVGLRWHPFITAIEVNGRPMYLEGGNWAGVNGRDGASIHPRRVGGDVAVLIDAAAALLGASTQDRDGGLSTTLSKGKSWVKLTSGSRIMETDRGKVRLPTKVWPIYGSRHVMLTAPLGAMARALGFEAGFVKERFVVKSRAKAAAKKLQSAEVADKKAD